MISGIICFSWRYLYVLFQIEHVLYEWHTGIQDLRPFSDDLIPAPGVDSAMVRYNRHVARILEWQNLDKALSDRILTQWMGNIRYVVICSLCL